MKREEIEGPLRELLTYIESADYAGFDPYDALNSSVIRSISGESKWARISFIQLLRRFPVNLRPLLGIKKGHNPKGLGLFLWGYSRLFSLDESDLFREKIDHLLGLLEQLRSRGYSGNCWGYNFDWQNRLMFVPAYTPTIVNSSFIGHALLDTYERCGSERALEMAIPIKDFLLNDLSRHREADSFCFSYTPIDRNFVHNANLLGASLLIRLFRICGESELEESALRSLSYSLHHQLQNGGWYYAETNVQRWIDSFHTGFNLQALQYFIDEGYGSLCQRQYDLGIDFYARSFFGTDGTPRYYHNRRFPLDIHSPCQAVVVFSRHLEEHGALVDSVLHWMLKHLYGGRGYFFFRKGRVLRNKIPYMRWSQAWAFQALTTRMLAFEGGGEQSRVGMDSA